MAPRITVALDGTAIQMVVALAFTFLRLHRLDKDRRIVLPSMATTSPWATSTTACIHRAKHPWRALGKRLIRTIRMQSSEGTPLANGKYFRNIA
jgi:hypothetical protein